MAVVLGLLVAAAFGSGDFLGGYASRRSPTLSVLATAQACALVGAIAVALLVGGDASSSDLLYGAIAGLFNVAALGCLFRGLATGRMSIVAPITAVVAAVIPVGWGLSTGERPSATALAGVVLAISAGALIGLEPDRTSGGGSGRALALALAIGAGVGFGCSFVFFAESADNSGFWPVLTARLAAVSVVVLVVLAARIPPWPNGPDRRPALAAGALDVAGTVCLLIAVRHGLAALVAPVAALGPAFTVGLAWGFLHEPIARWQVAGLGLALVGLSLIASG